MKIYTKIGDQGTTRLGDGTTVSKHDLHLDAYGSLDELNSALGVVRLYEKNQEILRLITEIQGKLFAMGSLLANPKKRAAWLRGENLETEGKTSVAAADISHLEEAIDRASADLPPLRNFILPGGCQAAAYYHLARTICRRAERELVRLHAQSAVPPLYLIYVNRLSDLLFTWARLANQAVGQEDIPW